MGGYFNNIYFANPEAFALLLLMPLIGWWFYRSYRKRYAEFRMSDLSGIKDLQSWKARSRVLLHILKSLAFVSLVVVLARPQRTLEEVKRYGEGIDIYLAIDLSSSMLARDFKPNRLTVCKREAIEFIDRREFDRIGLVSFAGEAFTQCPLTTDYNILKKFIDELEVGVLEDGTAIGMGLSAAINGLKELETKSKVVILLTDGMNNTGYIQPELAAELAVEFGIKVYTIGVGTRGNAYAPVSKSRSGEYFFRLSPVEIDETLLKKIANATGGQYFRATDERSLEQIYKRINELEKTKIERDPIVKKTEKYLPFALLGFFLLVLEFLLRYTVFRSLP